MSLVFWIVLGLGVLALAALALIVATRPTAAAAEQVLEDARYARSRAEALGVPEPVVVTEMLGSKEPVVTPPPGCHYCRQRAVERLVWLKDKSGQPARISVPWCGGGVLNVGSPSCHPQRIVERVWANPYPVQVGGDYTIEPLGRGDQGGVISETVKLPLRVATDGSGRRATAAADCSKPPPAGFTEQVRPDDRGTYMPPPRATTPPLRLRSESSSPPPPPPPPDNTVADMVTGYAVGSMLFGGHSSPPPPAADPPAAPPAPPPSPPVVYDPPASTSGAGDWGAGSSGSAGSFDSPPPPPPPSSD